MPELPDEIVWTLINTEDWGGGLERTYRAENVEHARHEFSASPEAMKIIDFISHRGHRHYAVPRLKGGVADDTDDED